MINLVLEKKPVDDIAEIAERFDEGELKAAVSDGRLAEWLTERFEDEIAERVKVLGNIGGDDFTERLIDALWPDADAKEAKTARSRVAAARERAMKEERQRQAAEAAKAKAEEEERLKKAEAAKRAAMLAAEQKRKQAAQAKAEEATHAKKAETRGKVEKATSRAMALLRELALSEVNAHPLREARRNKLLREARRFKIQWVSPRMDGCGIGVVFLDRNCRELGVQASFRVDEYDRHMMQPGRIFEL